MKPRYKTTDDPDLIIWFDKFKGLTTGHCGGGQTDAPVDNHAGGVNALLLMGAVKNVPVTSQFTVNAGNFGYVFNDLQDLIQ